MARRKFESKKQAQGVSNTPKFSIGEEFLVTASFFGEEWAKKTFGAAHNNFFLIGTIKKVMASAKKTVNYLVLFEYDGESYSFSESLLSQQQLSTIISADTPREKGYVVIPSAMRTNWSMASTLLPEGQLNEMVAQTTSKGMYYRERNVHYIFLLHNC
jgi:hypothetical protein